MGTASIRLADGTTVSVDRLDEDSNGGEVSAEEKRAALDALAAKIQVEHPGGISVEPGASVVIQNEADWWGNATATENPSLLTSYGVRLLAPQPPVLAQAPATARPAGPSTERLPPELRALGGTWLFGGYRDTYSYWEREDGLVARVAGIPRNDYGRIEASRDGGRTWTEIRPADPQPTEPANTAPTHSPSPPPVPAKLAEVGGDWLYDAGASRDGAYLWQSGTNPNLYGRLNPNGSIDISTNSGRSWRTLQPAGPHAAPPPAAVPPPAPQTFRDRGNSITVNPLTGNSRYMQDGSARYEVFQTAGSSPVKYRHKVDAGGAPIADTPWQRLQPASGNRPERWVNVDPNRQRTSPTTRAPAATVGRRGTAY